jgi:hypothetical protein
VRLKKGQSTCAAAAAIRVTTCPIKKSLCLLLFIVAPTYYQNQLKSEVSIYLATSFVTVQYFSLHDSWGLFLPLSAMHSAANKDREAHATIERGVSSFNQSIKLTHLMWRPPVVISRMMDFSPEKLITFKE